jgi:hypothetical protein
MAYTYLIGWSKEDIWYYGVRYAKKSKPEDLFTTYFTSSKYVWECVKKYGLPDIIQIRKLFVKTKKALLWEQKVLRRMKVLGHTRWLNKNISGAIFFDEEIREKCRIAKMNRTWLYNDKGKILIEDDLVGEYVKMGFIKGQGQRMIGKDNPMYGKKHTKKTLEKMSESKKSQGCTLTDEGRVKKSKYTKNNNPMDNVLVKKKHKEIMNKLKNQSKTVTDGKKVYPSIREANKDYPEVPYGTLHSWISKNKKGWNYVHP